MRITFVGTSHGKPQADRHCSSYMLEVGSGIYFVDAGASFYDAMRGYGKDAARLRAVFTTHAHSDHTNGLVHGIAALARECPNACYSVLLTSQAMVDALGGYLSAAGIPLPQGLSLPLAACGEVYRDENVIVTYHKTAHLKAIGQPAYGLVVREACGKGASVLFSGDLSFALNGGDFPSAEASEPHDLFVCELAHLYPAHLEPHLASSAVLRVAITHMNLPETKAPLAKEMAGRLPMPVQIMRDGDVIELSGRGDSV